MVAAHSVMLALAARGAGLGCRAQFGVPLVAAALLAMWFAWAESSALARVAAPLGTPRDPRAAIPIVLTMLGLIAAGSRRWSGRKRCARSTRPCHRGG